MIIIQGNFEELETWNPGHQDGRPFCILGSILNTFTPQTTVSLPRQRHLRTLLHNNKLLIKKFIIILTIYNTTQPK